MKSPKDIADSLMDAPSRIIDRGEDGMAVTFNKNGALLCCVASWGLGWDHVSVHVALPTPLDLSCVGEKMRCPTWDEMCFIKEIFFKEEETVCQFHPPKSQYVNTHPFCLHLWRNQTGTIELPPRNMV